MAEAHNLKLVISADTSDAEKKLKDVGNTKVPPVKVDVTAKKVKVDAPKVEPINVQAKFDETGAGRFVKTLNGVREVANRVMSALGLVGFTVGLVMSAVAAYNALKEKIEEVTTRAARLKFALEMQSAADNTNRLCSAHERLANLLKNELDTLTKQKAVGDIGKNGQRDLEDGRRAADRARQIYHASTPEEEQELRDRFAREDEKIALVRKQEDRRGTVRTLDEEESVYTSKARGLAENQAKIDEQLAAEYLNLKRAANPRINRGETEKTEDEKAIEQRIESLRKQKEANAVTIEAYEKEAKYRRDQIAALEAVQDYDGDSAAVLASLQTRKEKARENDRATTKADEDWKENRQREARRKDIERAVEDEDDNGNKRAILDAQAKGRRGEAQTLRGEYEAEMQKSSVSRDAEKLADLRAKIDALEAEAESYETGSRNIQRQENETRKSELEDYAGRIAGVTGPSQNRLTAMGLGDGSVRKDASRDILRGIRDLIEATKANKPVPAETAIVYS